MGAVWGSQEDTESAVGAPRGCSVASGMGRQYVQALREEQGQDKLAGLSLGAAQMMVHAAGTAAKSSLSRGSCLSGSWEFYRLAEEFWGEKHFGALDPRLRRRSGSSHL